MEPAELLRSLGSRIVADYREGTASSGPDAAPAADAAAEAAPLPGGFLQVQPPRAASGAADGAGRWRRVTSPSFRV